MQQDSKKPDLRDQIHTPSVSVTPPREEEENFLKSEGAPIASPDNAVVGQTSKM